MSVEDVEFDDDDRRCQKIVQVKKTGRFAQCKGWHTRQSDFCSGHELAREAGR